MRRVVVTGLGLVTPLADGVEKTWERILDAQSGAGPITRFDPEGFGTTYACEVPYGDGSDGTFNPDTYMHPKDQRKVDTFILFAMAAAEQAVADAGWKPEDVKDLERTGVLTGSGIGGLQSIAELRQRPVQNDVHRVVEIRLFRVFLQRLLFDALEIQTVLHVTHTSARLPLDSSQLRRSLDRFFANSMSIIWSVLSFALMVS